MEISFNFDRTEAAKALCETYGERFKISPEDLSKQLNEFNLISLVANGVCIGAVCVGSAIGHIGIKKEFRGKWGGAKQLKSLCEYFGVSKTLVALNNKRSQQWLKRCGWKQLEITENGIIYELS